MNHRSGEYRVGFADIGRLLSSIGNGLLRHRSRVIFGCVIPYVFNKVMRSRRRRDATYWPVVILRTRLVIAPPDLQGAVKGKYIRTRWLENAEKRN